MRFSLQGRTPKTWSGGDPFVALIVVAFTPLGTARVFTDTGHAWWVLAVGILVWLAAVLDVAWALVRPTPQMKHGSPAVFLDPTGREVDMWVTHVSKDAHGFEVTLESDSHVKWRTSYNTRFGIPAPRDGEGE